MFTVSSLFTILGFLSSRTATVSACDILLFLGFCLHLTIIRLWLRGTLEADAVDKDILKVVHRECVLMVEQSDVGEGHRDAVFVAGLDDIIVADGTAGLCDILHAALVGTLNVVAEGEESV